MIIAVGSAIFCIQRSSKVDPKRPRSNKTSDYVRPHRKKKRNGAEQYRNKTSEGRSVIWAERRPVASWQRRWDTALFSCERYHRKAGIPMSTKQIESGTPVRGNWDKSKNLEKKNKWEQNLYLLKERTKRDTEEAKWTVGAVRKGKIFFFTSFKEVADRDETTLPSKSKMILLCAPPMFYLQLSMRHFLFFFSIPEFFCCGCGSFFFFFFSVHFSVLRLMLLGIAVTYFRFAKIRHKYSVQSVFCSVVSRQIPNRDEPAHALDSHFRDGAHIRYFKGAC